MQATRLTLKATVSMGWVNAVMNSARALGVDDARLLSTAGIAADSLQWERWPIDYITRLWHAAERCSGDPGFGLKTGMRVTPANIHVLGFALQSAATLREAIGVLQKYQQLISDGGRFQMLTGPASTWLVYHPRQGQLAFSPHQIEAVLAAVVTLAGWIRGSALKPQRAHFTEGRIGPLRGYADAFDCPVEFDQIFSGLLLDNAALDQALPQADPQFAHVHAQYAAARLAALDASEVSVATLRRWLLAHMGQSVPRRAQAATALRISERTLCRRLSAEGTTFDGLLDDVRRELAMQAVADPGRSLADVAHSLGFADTTAFNRAFRRWTKLPPARWRRQGP